MFFISVLVGNLERCEDAATSASRRTPLERPKVF